MLWGGLQLIWSQLVLDVVTLSGWLYAVVTSSTKWGACVLVASCGLTLATAGPTNRWTLTLPMIPLLLLQGLRRIQGLSKFWSSVITFLSLLCILAAASLSVLFPAVELPAINGPYGVGIVDFHLPVGMSSSDNSTTCDAAAGGRHVPVRLLYPTLEKPTKKIPYLKPETAKEFCRQSMKFGAPQPIKEMGWILHTWRLSGLRVRRHAQLAPDEESFPVVVYSHGLGGNADMYSYQTMALAAHGNIVLALNHMDGTAPVVQRRDGELVVFSNDIVKLWVDGRKREYVRRRRAMTDARAEDVISATESFLQLNERDLPEFQQIGLSLRGRLQTHHIFFGGHSFGGATSLAAAARRPDLVKSVIAHEPAVDWMPDYALKSLFARDRLEGTNHSFSGGSCGYEDEADDVDGNSSLHDKDILVMFSHEWRQQKWGWSHILEDMQRIGNLGGKNSVYNVVDKAHHTEFSDTSMLTPLWLARAVGVTGQRNPIDTAKEISVRTLAFINNVRR